MYIIIDETTNKALRGQIDDRVQPGEQAILIHDEEFADDMLGSIFVDTSNYQPCPSACHIIENGKWVDTRTTEQRWEEVRAARNAELAASDWTQLGDAPMHYGLQAEWADWRQELRNLPQKYTDPAEASAQLQKLCDCKPS